MISWLWQLAYQQAAILQTRDEVIGVGLYGSLSYNRVTPFSDLDIFILTSESEHSPDVEHRLCDGIRVDFIWETLDRWQKIQYNPPQYMPWYPVKALLLGRDDSILYDPKNVIREKRDQLRQEVTYDKLITTYLASALQWISERLMMAIWQEEEGNFKKAWDTLNQWCYGYLFTMLTDLTNYKRIEESAQAIGIPELKENIQTIRRLKCVTDGLTSNYVRQVYEADKAHWEYQLEHVWQPLRRHLIAQGIESPDDLTVIGELILPYGGVRLYELGRALMEHSFSLEWAKAEMDQGDTLEAFEKICYENVIDRADEKWKRIESAINSAGYDTGTIISDFLAGEEFRERTEVAHRILNSPDAIPVAPEHVHQLITALYESTRLLSEYLVSHYPDVIEGMPDLYSLSWAEIIQQCRNRETHIDNDIVTIAVSKERAAVEKLIFKPGTNADLVETDWNDALLMDLSSISHYDLRKKWTLEKEEIGSDEARFVFSQDGGYQVDISITWSKTGITVEQSFRLPHPIPINNNIAIAGVDFPKSRDDYWATTINGEVQKGNYDYKAGPHVFIYPSDGTYFISEGCWIAVWNEGNDEVYGFTFSPNCGCLISRGASTDFEFYLPEGESTLRFHVITPKPSPPYLAIQQWAYDEGMIGFDFGMDVKSPYAINKS